MPIHDKKLIKTLRYKGGALRRNPSKVKIRFCEMIAKEYNLPIRTLRYYMFERKTSTAFYDKTYDLKYKRLVRHIDKILPQIFNGEAELSLIEMSSGIDKLTGVYIKERTLEKILNRYEGEPRGEPLVKTESGKYRLNDLFYKN
ncbi:unnamed protein product [marine sediment metagenome]|uniref:Uncharacterized protein n=1 Tax=marine sediment metagenome TaxID=412755 RepID=X0VPE0_9ZZZZ